MGMSIEEIIAKEQEMSEMFQKTVDTQMVSEDLSLDDMYCGDTEIIEEELKRCQELADFHNQIVDTMRKYQRIQAIVEAWKADVDIDSYDCMADIEEVIEDGNDEFDDSMSDWQGEDRWNQTS